MVFSKGFSVLMSVYYKETPFFLKLALQSLICQTLEPNEIILVKDGKLTLELEKVIQEFQSNYPLLKIITNKENLGLSNSLAKGLIECSFEYVARMDSDDICRSDRFETLMRHATENPEIDIIGSWAMKIDNEGNELGILKTPLGNAKIHSLIWACPFIHPSVLFKKNSIIEAGSYASEDGPRQDDYSLWFRCAFKKYKFENLPSTLIYYRFNSETINKNGISVGLARFRVGFRGCIKLKMGPKAFIGISIPLIRSLLPYPLNIQFYRITNKFNPRTQ